MATFYKRGGADDVIITVTTIKKTIRRRIMNIIRLRSHSQFIILQIFSIATFALMCWLHGGRFVPWQPMVPLSSTPQPDIIIEELRKQWRQLVPLSPILERLIGNNLTDLTYVNAGQPSGAVAVSFVRAECHHHNSSVVPSEEMPEPLEFQKLVPDNEDTFVFSAFFDRRWSPTPAVVIIGLTKVHSIPKYCRIWYSDDVIKEPHVTPLYYRYSIETHGRPFVPVFYTCFVRNKTVTPYAVSLVNDPCTWNNVLKVLTSPSPSSTSNSPRPSNFTVCLSPIHSNFDDVERLVEWIEVNRMYGAQHFIIYDYKSGENVSRYIEHFYRESLGVVTVIPWQLPVVANYSMVTKVHSFGQVAAINDCLYRCLTSGSTFAVFADVDEIIVPGRQDSWSAMLGDVTSQPGQSSLPAAYIFRNVLFRTDWPTDTTFANRSDEYQRLKTLSTTHREERIFEEFVRTKYIAWTKATVQLTIHWPAEVISPTVLLKVSEAECLVHHYRNWDDAPGRRVLDRRMHRYADKTAHSTNTVHKWMLTNAK